MQKFYNNSPLTIVNPELAFSTDDAAQCIFEGKGVDKDIFKLVSSKSLQNSGTRAKYKVSNANNVNGMRVKLTHAFSAAGTIAPIFITVLGLSERELPMHDCVAIDVEGLCIGGGGATVGNKLKGWLVFMRGQKGMDIERYKMHRDNVFLHFTQKTRSDFYGWKEGDAVASQLRAVSWCDGDLAQIENIANESSLNLHEEHNITACKKINREQGQNKLQI